MAAVQLEEVRGLGPDRPAAVTLSWSAAAIGAAAQAFSEQLARRRSAPLQDAGDVLVLRAQATLGERFQELSIAQASAMVVFDDTELASIRSALCAYVRRVDVDAYQPPELRERIAVLREVTVALCEAISEARAAVAAGPAAVR